MQRSGEFRQVSVKRADIRVDAHLVVVEDYQQVIGVVGGVVESLESQTSAD